MQDKPNARQPYHRRLAYLLGPAMLAASIAIGGPAQAAVGGTARPAVPCVYQWGKTSVHPPGKNPSGGTTFVKPRSTGCRDLNLLRVSQTDNYIGYLLVGPGKWRACRRGWVPLSQGYHNFAVLCSGVVSGTSMMVVAQRHSFVPIEVAM
jgi:hypothetical protein